MRPLLAMALILAGSFVLAGPADARKQRYYQPRYYQPYYYQPPPPSYGAPRYYNRERAVCEERARNEDPSGLYAGFPCWAREAFGRGSGGGRR